MKKKIQIVMLSFVLASFSLNSFAQSENETNVRSKSPKWVCEEGYWVVESNIKDKLNHIVYFYNDQKQLIGRKELTGVKLNLRKAKTKKMLKESLEASMQTWAAR